jgi:hypothetical protein
VELRDYPSFAPLFLMHVPVPAIAQRLVELRHEHAAIFRTLGAEVAERHGIGRDRAQISTYLALGSLAYLCRWYDPGGELGVEQMADVVAAELVRPFTGGA